MKGNIIGLAEAGAFDVLVHGCNCFCTMGAGLAAQIKRAFPEAFEADQKTVVGDKKKLGTYSSVKLELEHGQLIIVNAYTQFGYGRDRPQTDYAALRKVFRQIAIDFKDKHIAYPLIGSGLGGGEWLEISQIIGQELKGLKHTLVTLD